MVPEKSTLLSVLTFLLGLLIGLLIANGNFEIRQIAGLFQKCAINERNLYFAPFSPRSLPRETPMVTLQQEMRLEKIVERILATDIEELQEDFSDIIDEIKEVQGMSNGKL